MLDGGQAARRQEDLHDGFVHPYRGRQDSRTHVRYVGQLQQALQRSVLAVRAMQDRKDHVERQAGYEGALAVLTALGEVAVPLDGQDRFLAGSCDQVGFVAGSCGPSRLETCFLDDFGGRDSRRVAIRDGPPPILPDADGDQFIARAVKVGDDSSGGGQRHFVLTGSAPVDHPNAESFHARPQGFR